MADRMLLIIFIQRDEMSVTGLRAASTRPGRGASSGTVVTGGRNRMRDRPRPGRPPKVHKGVMKKIREDDAKDCLLGAERCRVS